MIDGNIKESLYLVGMQVHGDQTVDTSGTEQVGHKFCTDAHTRLVLPVLTCPSEIRDDSVDALCRSTLGGINHKQQLHQIV